VKLDTHICPLRQCSDPQLSKNAAERSLKAANDPLARLKAAKADSDAAAAQAVEDLARERKAREAAEQALPPPPAP
jgi:hypothetical protein